LVQAEFVAWSEPLQVGPRGKTSPYLLSSNPYFARAYALVDKFELAFFEFGRLFEDIATFLPRNGIRKHVLRFAQFVGLFNDVSDTTSLNRDWQHPITNFLL